MFHDSYDPKSIVHSVGNPKMLLGDVTKVNAAMIVRDCVMITPLCAVTNKFDRIAPSQVIVDVTAAINAGRRFTAELSYPARSGTERALAPSVALAKRSEEMRPAAGRGARGLSVAQSGAMPRQCMRHRKGTTP